ncbi:unnamed protein product [Rotaria sordida]|uniref:Uncharacterized protein n=1 Tax=Rotaria sordida TaxID=392033 RepID=A0A815AJU8_9BILA|nr:unnamed protein product [Rotaria sordida]CAF1065071.1 unnamed protein product [Rotaria sordida]CAF1074932.1 unnamed protein product [Rotaria sordida]CAF1094456.1 unnamed protein product [Rotaria sordida]CAF1258437.1 unnamed protein product [Rotaria sordida]
MCGDGANDVGALKAAHAGISLSTADASVASPFTSRTPTIECVPTIIREGRAALVTSFGVVKYMVAYSLTQFLTVIMLYTIGNNLTDYEFLFIDLGLITLLVLLFSRTTAYPYLDPKAPRTKLISWRPLVSLIGHLSICAAFQAFIFEYVKKQPWYEPFEFNEEKIYISHINTAVFLQSTFQYIWESIVFSRGAPYRRSIFSNWLFLISIVLTFGFSCFLLFIPIKSVYTFFELRIIPDIKFKLIIFGLAILNFIIMHMFEEYIIENDHVSCKRSPLSSTSRNITSRSGTHHLHIENILRLTPDWPPILATPSEEEKLPEHVLVNETKKNNQITTNEFF